MADWVVGIAWCEPRADSEGACRDTSAAESVGFVSVSLVSLQNKSIDWRLMPTELSLESVLTHCRVLLDDLRCRSGAAQAKPIDIVVSHSACTDLMERLACALRDLRCLWKVAANAERVQRDLVDEALLQLLRPSSVAVWNETQKTVETSAFDACVRSLFGALDETGGVVGDPKFERSFCLRFEEDAIPLRPYLRRNTEMQSALCTQHPSIEKLLRPFCRSKRGARLLQTRIDRPEVDPVLIRRRHDLLSEMIVGLSGRAAFGHAVVTLLDCAREAELSIPWFCDSQRQRPTTSPSLQDFTTFGQWIDQIEVASWALQAEIDAATMPLLHELFTSQLSATSRAVASAFSKSAMQQIARFEARGSFSQDHDGSVASLRGQVDELEEAIAAHKSQMAVQLLLRPERIKVVFEIDDFTRTRSMAAISHSVLFRVTRQDAHRVFRASTNAKSDAQANSTVTLVFSRRTTGVWFSTRRLDDLAAQRRTLLLAISRLESQLISSLVTQFNQQARQSIVDRLAQIADLDILSSFAQVSIRHGYQRATVMVDSCRVLRTVGLRSPWAVGTEYGSPTPHKRPRTTVSSDLNRTQVCSLDARQPMIAIHSAVDDDASILVRLGGTITLNQIGCFVPCIEAKLPVFDALFLRTGAVDSTLENASTFFTEMHQMSSILRRLTPRSLVLVDELCRGTAPDEGLPLAVEICRFLIQESFFACVATQWTELFDSLVAIDRVTVPTTDDHDSAASATKKKLYHKRLDACDEQFVENLTDSAFPSEIVEWITHDLTRLID